MATRDLNQLTISGQLRSTPQLRRFDDGDSVCTFVLTHSSDHHQTGNVELQFYNVSIWGSDAEYFADTVEIDQRIVVTGRLDCVYDQTLTGYQPIVSIIAERIITITGQAEDNGYTEQLALP